MQINQQVIIIRIENLMRMDKGEQAPKMNIMNQNKVITLRGYPESVVSKIYIRLDAQQKMSTSMPFKVVAKLSMLPVKKKNIYYSAAVNQGT